MSPLVILAAVAFVGVALSRGRAPATANGCAGQITDAFFAHGEEAVALLKKSGGDFGERIALGTDAALLDELIACYETHGGDTAEPIDLAKLKQCRGRVRDAVSSALEHASAADLRQAAAVLETAAKPLHLHECLAALAKRKEDGA